MRQHMRASDGVYMSVELHATDWLGGRGRVAKSPIPKGARARLYQYVLSAISRLPGAQLINAFGRKGEDYVLFERLINRINVNMTHASSQCIIISDEGKQYDKLLRRMRRFNYVPSRYGVWPGGAPAAHKPINRIIEVSCCRFRGHRV